MNKGIKVYIALFVAALIFALYSMTVPDILLERRREAQVFELGYARNIERLNESTDKFKAYSDAKAAYELLENSNIKNVAAKDPEVKDWLDRNKDMCDRLYNWCVGKTAYNGTINEGVLDILDKCDICVYAI